MELLTDIISWETLTALVLTIMHSLWIGVVISVVAAILFVLIRKSARTRYNIATSGLAIILLSSTLIFINIRTDLSEISANGIMVEKEFPELKTEKEIAGQSFQSVRQSIIQNTKVITGKLQRLFIYHSDFILMIWIIGVFVFGTKFTLASIYASRFRKRGVSNLPDLWISTLERIARKVNLNKKITAVQSCYCEIPMVTGWLKPILIVPASVLTTLPVDQVEAIIAHELAHIKRSDYLVNVLQTLIEIIMFYNPSVWFISEIMRREREACCDDLALSAGNNTIVYAKALLSLQEVKQYPPVQAVTFKMKNNNLITRIKRIAAMKTKKNYLKEKIIATSGIAFMITALVLLTGFKTEIYSSAQDFRVNTINENTIFDQDTLRKKNSGTIKTIWTDPSDNLEKNVKMTVENGNITELIIEGEVIPQKDYHLYQDQIDDTTKEYEKAMQEIEDINFEEIEKEIEEAKLEIEEIDMEDIAIDIEEAMKEIEEIDMEDIAIDIEEAMKEIEEIDMEEIEREIEEAKLEIEKIDMKEIEKKINEAKAGNIEIKKVKKEN